MPEWARLPPSEWKFVVYSLTIELHFKNSDCTLYAFQIFGHIHVTGSGRNVLLMLRTFEVHSKRRNIDRQWKCILTALWVLSKYYYSIPTSFHTFWSHSRRIKMASPYSLHTASPIQPSTGLIFSGSSPSFFSWPPPHLFPADLAGGQQSEAKQHRPVGPYSTAVD